MSAAQDHPSDKPSDKPASKPKPTKPRLTFMLHDPSTMASLGKFVSTDYRYAALKAATRGHTRIMLRKTNTKEVREFEGKVLTLDAPKIIKRTGEGKSPREVEYNKRPSVKFLRKFVFDGAPTEEDPAPNTAPQPST